MTAGARSAKLARMHSSQRGPAPATQPEDPDPRFDSFSAGEADPPPHRPRHAASPSSPPDGRRGACGAGATTPEKLRATRTIAGVVAQRDRSVLAACLALLFAASSVRAQDAPAPGAPAAAAEEEEDEEVRGLRANEPGAYAGYTLF